MLSNNSAIRDLSPQERLHIVADYPYDWEYWQLPDGSFEYVSPSCLRITGHGPEAFFENPQLYLQIIHPDDTKNFEGHQCLLSGEQAMPLEFRIITKEGKVVWLEHICHKIYSEKKEFLGCRVSNRDITERKKMQEQLYRSYTEKKLFIELAQVGTWEYDVKTDMIIPDERFRILFDLPRDTVSLPFNEIVELIHHDDRTHVTLLFRNALRAHNGFFQDVHRVLWRDGSIHWISAKSRVFYEKKGARRKPFRMIGTIVDVTQIKKAQEEAESGRRKLEAVLDILPVGVIICDAGGKLLSVNPAVEKIWEGPVRLSETFEDYKSDYRAWWPDGRRISSKDWALTRAVTLGQTVLSEEMRIETKKGTHKNIINYGLPIKDKKGQIVGGVAINVDITERKQVEEDLRKKRADLNRAQAVAKVGNWLMNIVTNELTWSDETYHIFEIPVGTPLRYEDFLAKVHPEDRQRLDESWRAAIANRAQYNIQHRILIDDRVKWIHEISELEFDKEGNLIGAFGTAQDITELKKIEQSLQQSREILLDLKEQLESKNRELESIIGVVSHDLRSPLVSINGFSQEITFSCKNAEESLTKTGLKSEFIEAVSAILSKEIPEYLAYIQSSTSRMDMLVRSLVKVARAGMAEIHPEMLDMNALLAEAVAAIAFKIKETGTELKISELPMCFADKTQTSQIFSNLLDNAVKYLDPDRPGQIQVYGCTDQSRSIYTIEDNGIGIPIEFQDKIFDLFSRVDETDKKGEGIGLAMVKRMVGRNNGLIWLESESGKGTKFSVSLPRFEY